MKKLTVLTTLLLIIGAFLTVAQRAHNQERVSNSMAQSLCGSAVNRFNVWPQPAWAGEKIQLVASGIWRNGCTPQFESLERNGDSVNLFLIGGPPPGYACTGAETPWSIEAEAGVFSSATYTASLYITDRDDSEGPVLCATSPMYVFDTVYQSFLPKISKK